MEHLTDDTQRPDADEDTARNALMHAMASAEQAVSQLAVPPYDVTLTRDHRAGAYDVHLFYSRHPEAVTAFAEAHGVGAEAVENTVSPGTVFTQATAAVTGTRVRAWTLTDAPQDAEQLADEDTPPLAVAERPAEAAAEGAAEC